jgi:hypothetical protein
MWIVAFGLPFYKKLLAFKSIVVTVMTVNNFWEKQKMTHAPSIMIPLMKLKTVHSLLTEQRQLAYIGEHINTDNLRAIRNIALDVVDITYEISEAQTKQTEKTND